MDQADQTRTDFTELTAEIVSAYVANNSVHRGELPNVIASVHAALQGLVAPKPAVPEKLQPPIPIKKSITSDFLVSFEDGRLYKSLKRHLSSRGMTPAQYRAKWGLPSDYPMVAPNYAKRRSELAKSMGLGQVRRSEAPAETERKAAEPASAGAPAKAARSPRSGVRSGAGQAKRGSKKPAAAVE